MLNKNESVPNPEYSNVQPDTTEQCEQREQLRKGIGYSSLEGALEGSDYRFKKYMRQALDLGFLPVEGVEWQAHQDTLQTYTVRLQTMLNKAKFSSYLRYGKVEDGVDGLFGKRTLKALKAFHEGGAVPLDKQKQEVDQKGPERVRVNLSVDDVMLADSVDIIDTINAAKTGDIEGLEDIAEDMKGQGERLEELYSDDLESQKSAEEKEGLGNGLEAFDESVAALDRQDAEYKFSLLKKGRGMARFTVDVPWSADQAFVTLQLSPEGDVVSWFVKYQPHSFTKSEVLRESGRLQVEKIDNGNWTKLYFAITADIKRLEANS